MKMRLQINLSFSIHTMNSLACINHRYIFNARLWHDIFDIFCVFLPVFNIIDFIVVLLIMFENTMSFCTATCLAFEIAWNAWTVFLKWRTNEGRHELELIDGKLLYKIMCKWTYLDKHMSIFTFVIITPSVYPLGAHCLMAKGDGLMTIFTILSLQMVNEKNRLLQ